MIFNSRCLVFVPHHLVWMTARVKTLAWRDLATSVFALTGEWATNVRTGPVSRNKIAPSFWYGYVDTRRIKWQIPFLKSHLVLAILLFVSLWWRCSKVGGGVDERVGILCEGSICRKHIKNKIISFKIQQIPFATPRQKHCCRKYFSSSDPRIYITRNNFSYFSSWKPCAF